MDMFQWERAQLCQGATQTPLGSLGSTAGLTPAQTQLLEGQPRIKMGLSREEAELGSLSFSNQMILSFYNYFTTSFRWRQVSPVWDKQQ